MKNWIWIAALVALVLGCSGKSDKPAQAKPGGSYGGNDAQSTGGRNGGNGGTSVGGGGAAAGTGQVGGRGEGGVNQLLLAPTVEILAPQAVSDADIGPVLVGLTINVLCKVTKSTATGATDVAGSTVTISLIPTTGGSVDKSGVLATGQADEYTANFPLDKIPNGPVSFSCTASDTATPPHVGTSTIVTTFVDHGPTISNAVPVANAAFPLKSSRHFQFNVAPVPLATGDQGAAIGDVILQVDSYKYAIPPNAATPGQYGIDVNFGDASKFSQQLNGPILVQIFAPNKRNNPGPVTSTKSYNIVLDGDAPAIKINDPAEFSIIGGPRMLKFSVTDVSSGVDSSLVFVNLGTDSSIQPTTYQYDPNDPATWSKTNVPPTTDFTFSFDSNNFVTTDSQVTVSIKATDLAGNEATSQIVLYYLDNVPPFISLDPPDVRLITADNSTSVYCSAPFDPVGSSVPNAGAIINSFSFFRAFAWDQTNGKPSQRIFYYSGIDATKVHLYLQSDPTKRIIYDKTGDGICDHIDDDVKLLPFQPNLDPVTETGAANNFPTDLTTLPDVSAGFDISNGVPGKSCEKNANDPQRLCTNQFSEMTVALHQKYASSTAGLNDAAIYALSVKQDDPACTGTDWDISKFVPTEGWVCLAAEATDGVGNTGISAPIALCFDNELTTSKPSCATGKPGTVSTEKPPSCITDGCKPSSKSLVGDWDATNAVYVPFDIGNPVPFPIRYN